MTLVVVAALATSDRAHAYEPRETDLSGLAPNLDNVPMVELLARDLVPLAILHSAGVMKLYLDEAYARPPGDDSNDDDPRPGAGQAGAGCATASPDGAAAAALFALALYPLFRLRSTK